MALFDRVHDAGQLITFTDYRIKQLQEELDAPKSNDVRRRSPRPRSTHPSLMRATRGAREDQAGERRGALKA
ncbi:hypothetical protein B296_00029363 [Ensete ventricosum]|uniref:Uncharacterized protein n=1 Tax=Ensete ventricosum TaxID=4639 RepID=A0A426XWT7_ENSVE|nr:hypothetical protein B296_00029363 [Ensete ventricosum]